ncbi:hypothetical protein GEMRC1_013459 [Eukaryota sp. GEM-RC1]
MILSKKTTQKPALFLAPKRALVEQHYSSWLTDIPNLRNAKMYMGNFLSFDAVFATPGWIYDKLIATETVSPSQLFDCFSLLVLDEVHHVNHPSTPQAKVVDLWRTYNAIPFFGLSASPVEVKKPEKAEQALRSFLSSLNTVLLKPIKHLDEYNLFTNNTNIATVNARLDSLPYTCIIALLDQALTDIKHVLTSNISYLPLYCYEKMGKEEFESQCAALTHDESVMFVEFSKYLDQIKSLLVDWKLTGKRDLLNRAQHMAIELQMFVQCCIDSFKDHSNPSFRISSADDVFPYLDIDTIVSPVFAAFNSILPDRRIYSKPDGDVMCCPSIVDLLLEEHRRSGDNFSALVMAVTRAGSRSICIALQNHPDLPFVRAGYVVGKGKQSVFGGSLTKLRLDKLRSGELNVIVGTSVLQEGIDVPKCNIAIATHLEPTATALIQTSGRVRAMSGKFVVVLFSDFHKKKIADTEARRSALIKSADRIASQPFASSPWFILN